MGRKTTWAEFLDQADNSCFEGVGFGVEMVGDGSNQCYGPLIVRESVKDASLKENRTFCESWAENSAGRPRQKEAFEPLLWGLTSPSKVSQLVVGMED